MKRLLSEELSDINQAAHTKRYRTIMQEPVEKLSPFPVFKYWGYGVKTLLENLYYEMEHKHTIKDFKPLVFGIGTNRNTHTKTGAVHSHEYMQVFYVIKGGLKCEYCSQEFIQKEGSFVIVPPFFPHTIEWLSSDTVFIQLDFSERLIAPNLEKGSGDTFVKSQFISPILSTCAKPSPLININISDRQYIQGILSDLMEEYYLGTNFSLTYVRIKIIELFSYLSECAQPKTSSDSAFSIVRALRYIMENSINGVTRQEVADFAHISPSLLFELIKKATGLNFSQLTNYLKVHHAQRLLIKTDKPLNYICHNSGFCDSAYFNNTFKKFTSMTPSTYRETFRPNNTSYLCNF